MQEMSAFIEISLQSILRLLHLGSLQLPLGCTVAFGAEDDRDGSVRFLASVTAILVPWEG